MSRCCCSLIIEGGTLELGEYIATRVLGGATDPAIDAAFVLPGDAQREREDLDNLEELL